MQSTTDEMISLDLIRIHVKALQGENGMLKYRQLPNSVILLTLPSFLHPTFHVAYQGLASFFQSGSSIILWFSQVTDFFLKNHPITSPVVVPLPTHPHEYFWNLIYFCKTRQNWNIPRATNNGLHIESSLPSTESCVCLRAKLDRKAQNCINNLKANYYSSHLPSFKASQPRKCITLNTQLGSILSNRSKRGKGFFNFPVTFKRRST